MPSAWAFRNSDHVGPERLGAGPRPGRTDLLILDELAYVPLTQAGAELLFQILDKRTESSSIALTTNLPFGGADQGVPRAPRLCKAMVDQLTFTAHRVVALPPGRGTPEGSQDAWMAPFLARPGPYPVSERGSQSLTEPRFRAGPENDQPGGGGARSDHHAGATGSCHSQTTHVFG